MNQSIVGKPILRLEDKRFLTGRGQFTDDFLYTDLLHGVVLRSPHAHAKITNVNIGRALKMPGVADILVGESITGLQPLPDIIGIDRNILRDRNGELPRTPNQWPLTKDKARYVGDPIAFVVAESIEQAKDAVESIDVSYQALPAVIDYDDALSANTKIWDEFKDNQTFEWAEGDKQAAETIFSHATHVAEIDVDNCRQIVAFMEPRSIVADYDYELDQFHIRLGAQSAHSIRAVLAHIFSLDPKQFHVIVPDTGGGFGARNIVYPEFILATYAARKLGRPVRWTSERSESFVSDTQARDQRVKAKLALDKNGRFLAIQTSVYWRHGAFVPTRSHWVHITFMPLMMCGPYEIDACYFEMIGLFSNTAPVHAFRGVGRAEATYIIERLVDQASLITGINRVELRRRNLAKTPCTTATGARYGKCDFEANMDKTLDLIDSKNFESRRIQSKANGQLRGLGIANYVESTGGMPTEFAQVDLQANKIVAYMGTKSFGMGHETVFAQVLADELQIELEHIEICDGDTDLVKNGAGSHGSRSMRIGGGALVMGARNLLENAKRKAGEYLEAATEDIEYIEGQFLIKGTDQGLSLLELGNHYAGDNLVISGEAVFETKNHAFSNGCHACELEIDPETGYIKIINHALVIDAGNIVNPMIVTGQLHGGITQGLGQALLEQVVYDSKQGQLLSGSFLDYTIPRADDLCWFNVGFNEIPSEDNPLGVKGAGEGPTTGSPPAAVSAVLHALRPLGITHVDMPLTREHLWRYIRKARDKH